VDFREVSTKGTHTDPSDHFTLPVKLSLDGSGTDAKLRAWAEAWVQRADDEEKHEEGSVIRRILPESIAQGGFRVSLGGKLQDLAALESQDNSWTA
jgi:hypothetical protein